MRLVKLQILLVILLLLTLAVPCVAKQNPNLRDRPLPITTGTESENWKSQISYLSQSLGTNETIVLISRLGKRELSRKLSRERLKVARLYLVTSRGSEPQLKDESVVTAEGERVNDRGRIEAYVRGRLFMVFIFEPGKNFSSDP